MSQDRIILSYHDCILRESDVKLLKGSHWLNDQLISFYFEYLEKEKCFDGNDILFIGPEVVHCLKGAELNELSIFLDPLNAKKKHIILFALNNCGSLEGGGGSHWSLLVYSKKKRKMYHLDSIRSTNYSEAVMISKKLVKYLAPDNESKFYEISCHQQNNSYDCGLFVMLFAEIIAKTADFEEALEKCRKIDSNQVAVKRIDILDLIESKANKK